MIQKKPCYEFSAEKNHSLIKERNISFEEIITALDSDKLLDTIKHHNLENYPNQQIYVIEVRSYVYLVPFVRKDEKAVFLKTIIPSRKFTKIYLSKEGDVECKIK
jgi:uncharacterized DUF497 family protein